MCGLVVYQIAKVVGILERICVLAISYCTCVRDNTKSHVDQFKGRNLLYASVL
jgi:hypothetical protein